MGIFDLFRSRNVDLVALDKLISVMQRPELGRELSEFLQEDRSFRKRFLALSNHPGFSQGDTTLVRWQVNQLLVSYGLHCAEHGNMHRATSSLLFAQAFAP